MRDQVFAGISGYDGAGADVGDTGPYVVAVVGGVGESMLGPEALDQGWCLWRTAGLARGQDDAKRPALGIGDQVDLGGQSASGTPQSLVLVPPFPVAAC